MKFRLTIILGLLGYSTSAQEMWGINNSNFSGHMGMFLNPTIVVAAPYQYEINLVALDQFAENTFIYLPLTEKIVTLGIADNLRDKELYNNSSNSLNGFSHEFIIGPSYLHNKKEYTWGLHSAFRSVQSILKISPEQANLIHHDFDEPAIAGIRQSSKPYTSVYASWFEVGGTYGKIYKEDEFNMWKWAGNANILIGNRAYTYDGREMDYTSVDSTQVIVHRLEGDLSHTTTSSAFGLNGLGLSTTIGLVYIKKPNRGAFECAMANDKQRKYKYRLGASLIDLGAIHYFSNTHVDNFVLNNDYVWNGVDTLSFSSIQQFDSTLVRDLGGTSQEEGFNIFLPLALSVQFDYQIKPNIFANASVINRLHFLKNQLARGNQFDLSLRYERRRYEATLHLALFEYKKPALGLGLRYRFLVVGSDRLLQLAGLSDAPSYDIFFGIKFQFCKRPFSPGPDCPAYLSH